MKHKLGTVGLAFALGALGATFAGGCGSSSSAGAKASGGTSAGGEAGDGDGVGGDVNAGGTIPTSGGSSGKGTGGSSTGGTNNGGSTTGGTSNGGSGLIGASGDGAITTDTACNNGLDDDDDGLTDGFDPECVSPLDNDEGSFATGIPGDNKDPKWQDCFFDGNSGGGDDGCRYPTECLTGDYAADDERCEVAQGCIDYCRQLTPNGCDCFGCCTVQDSSGNDVDVLTATTCSLDTIDDEDACPRCQKSIGCDNPCGECELCPGKTIADLPSTCTPPPTGEGGMGGGPDQPGTEDGGTPPPPAYTCDEGQQVCGDGLPRCPSGLYCSLGCCMVIIR